MTRKSSHSESGAILPIVIILMLALTITGLAFLNAGVMENRLVGREIHKNQAFYLAEAGIEKVVYYLFKVNSAWREGIRTGNWPSEGEVVNELFGDGHYEVTIKLKNNPTSDNTADIESIGFVKDAIRKIHVEAYVINHIEDSILCLGGISSGKSNKKPKDAARNGNEVFMAKHSSTVMVDGNIHSNNEIFFTSDKRKINGVDNVSLTGSITALRGEEPQVENPWFNVEKYKARALEEEAATGIKHVFTVQEFNDLVKNTPVVNITGTVYVYVDGPPNIYDKPGKGLRKKFELKLKKKDGVINIKNGSLFIDIPGLPDHPGYYRDPKGKLKEIKIKVDNNLYINVNSEPLPYQPALMSSGAMFDLHPGEFEHLDPAKSNKETIKNVDKKLTKEEKEETGPNILDTYGDILYWFREEDEKNKDYKKRLEELIKESSLEDNSEWLTEILEYDYENTEVIIYPYTTIGEIYDYYGSLFGLTRNPGETDYDFIDRIIAVTIELMDIGTSQLNIKGLIYTPTLFELKTKKRKKDEEPGTGNVYITGAIAAGGVYIEHKTDKDIVSITYNKDYIPQRSILQWTEGP